MSRILIATAPFVGHVSPATVLARELARRGHDLAWYTGRAFQEAVEATGARVAPKHPALDYDPTRLDERFPERRNLRGLAQITHDIKTTGADMLPQFLEDLAGVLSTFPADALLSDSTFIAGKGVRHRHGLPWVSFGPMPLTCGSRDTAPFGLGLPPSPGALGRARHALLNLVFERVLLREGMRHLRRAERALGVPVSRDTLMDSLVRDPDLYLQASVPELEYLRHDLPGNVRFIGPLLPPPGAEFARPAWWTELMGPRPVVHVTQGTVDNRDLSKLLVPTLAALAHEDVLVVATTGGRPLDEVTMPLPANVRLERFIPHDQLLPHVSVLVTNAGFGGVQRALAAGVPLVVAGDTEDKPEVAARVAWSGVGVNLRGGRPGPERLRRAVLEVLQNPRYRTRAQALGRVIARHDAGREAADLVEAVLRGQRFPAATRIPRLVPA